MPTYLKYKYIFFFISISGRKRNIFLAKPDPDPDPWKKMSDPHPCLSRNKGSNSGTSGDLDLEEGVGPDENGVEAREELIEEDLE